MLGGQAVEIAQRVFGMGGIFPFQYQLRQLQVRVTVSRIDCEDLLKSVARADFVTGEQ